MCVRRLLAETDSLRQLLQSSNDETSRLRLSSNNLASSLSRLEEKLLVEEKRSKDTADKSTISTSVNNKLSGDNEVLRGENNSLRQQILVLEQKLNVSTENETYCHSNNKEACCCECRMSLDSGEMLYFKQPQRTSLCTKLYLYAVSAS
jgi:hypothetical protein